MILAPTRLAPTRLAPTRLAVLLSGDRFIAAAIRGHRVETFAIDAENRAAALRAELDQRKLAPRGVFLGLPRGSVTVKPIELPAVDGQLDEMVRFELERHLPYASDDAAFDWIPLAAERDGGAAATGRSVVIAAAERRVVDGALRFAEDARLRPLSITVASHNLPALVRPDGRQRVVWVHRMGQDAELLFLRGGALVASRTLPGADDAQIVTEVRRTFNLTHWRDCDAVWLSGDVEPGVPSALAELGAPVSEPPWTQRAQRLLHDVTEEPRGARELVVAVAAAGRPRPLELLPRALRPRRLSRPQLATTGMAVLAVLFAVAALLAPGYRENRRLAAINTRIASLDTEVKAVERVLAELERKRGLLATIQSLEAGSVRPLPVLRDLTDLLPTDAWITLLSFDTKGVELAGQAAAAAALIPLLENSPRLERVEFSSPVTRGRDREQFRIRAAWEGGTPAAAMVPAAPGPAGPAPAAPGADGGVMQPRRPITFPPGGAAR